MTSLPIAGANIVVDRKWPVFAAFVLVYVAVSLAARPHGTAESQLLPWYAGTALSFALLARLGAGMAPAVIVASLTAAIWRAGGSATAAALAVQTVAEVTACLAGAALLRSRIGVMPSFSRVRHVVWFFIAVALTSLLVAMPVLFEAFREGGSLRSSSIAFARQGLATATALLMIAPLLIIGAGSGQRTSRASLVTIETVLQAAALAIMSWEVFGRFVNEEIHFFYLLFLPLGWIATRHGQPGAVLALAVIYLAPLISDWFVPHREQAIIELQIRLIVLASTMLLLGAVVSDRRKTQESMLERQAELAHVQRLNVGWEMASALSHEINQPLTAAMNYTQASLRLIAMPEPDMERTKAAMRKSLEQIERAGQIVHGLRDFMNKGELRLALTDVAEPVGDAMRLVAAEANAGGIRLDIRDVDSLPPVMADKTQLVQILVNLMRNAIQALVAAQMTGTVAVTGSLIDGKVEVAVSDNGPGIDPAVRTRLFEPFITTKSSGMGLGLSISRSIAEAHNGSLSVDYSVTGGTVFRIVLPAAHRVS